ncbi:MAG TPA: hypothetical protein VJI98_00795 [Candidatus Nanoarchaeia archaeon]|nr:hypothetical protein [Candidatus Nanoarchaeia archaeon]
MTLSTAVERLIRDGNSLELDELTSVLGATFDDLGVRTMVPNNGLGELISKFWLTDEGSPSTQRNIDQAISDLAAGKQREFDGPRYVGTFEQNRSILVDKHICPKFTMPSYSLATASPHYLIAGNGAAAIILIRSLRELGVPKNSISWIGEGNVKGIWGGRRNGDQNHLRNVPFAFSYDRQVIPTTTSNDYRGEVIIDFLDGLTSRYRRKFPDCIDGKVIGVTVNSENDHDVIYVTPNGIETRLNANFVFLCFGNGKLRDYRKGLIEVNGIESRIPIHRTQRVITPEEREHLQGKSVVIWGWGNSAIEMVAKMQKLGINYHVVTTYPRESVNHPEAVVHKDGRAYQTFRTPDLKTGSLVRIAGDLYRIRSAYYKALTEGRISAEVNSLNLDDDNNLIIRSPFETKSVKCDEIYILIGSQYTPEILEPFGILTDSAGRVAQDFTGALHVNGIPDKRTSGMYGLGGLLHRTHPDGITIAGMHRQIELMIPELILRAEANGYSFPLRSKS